MITVIKGDNVEVMDTLAGEARRFTLVYADPPFHTGRVHHMADGKEVAFDDRWPSLQVYMGALEVVSRGARELLDPHGSFVLHVDSKISHYAKVMLDGVFGADHFASEIIWRYRRWPTKTSNYQRVHDVLLRYRKDINVLPRFQQLYEPLSPKTIATWGTRKQKAVWDTAAHKANKLSPPRRKRSSVTAEQSPGVPLGDVWDIGIVAPVSRERTGFPTQKPEKLLERLVSSLTLPGDSVLDPYMGSGTTLRVCERLGRSAVGIDSSDVAVRVAHRRLFGSEPAAAVGVAK